MFKKIENAHIDKGFIQIFYPGAALSRGDTGIGSIGRIDHAHVSGGGFIAMHPHVNDEILSYFRTGKAEHKDSEGFVEIIGGTKLMLMKAGRSFYHQERMLAEEPLEGLQIFIRPAIKDLDPEVLFLDLQELHSENAWRLIASPAAETHFQFSSQTWLYDIRLLKGSSIALPAMSKEDLTSLLYVFKGEISIQRADKSVSHLIGKDSALIQEEKVLISALQDADLVLFITDEQSEIYKEGMFSGNKK